MLKNTNGQLKKFIFPIIILLVMCIFIFSVNYNFVLNSSVYSLSTSGFHATASCPQWQALHAKNINMPSKAIPTRFRLVVWNIYKYQDLQWRTALDKLSQSTDVLMLQEAVANEATNQYWLTRQWHGVLVNAFQVGDTAFGVQTLAKEITEQVCISLMAEPYIRVPKSALAVKYSWQGSDLPLLLINIHGINFTLGTEALKAQLLPLLQTIEAHQGPVIFAGDFNTWSQARTDLLDSLLARLGLSSVTFAPDHRLRVMGMPLDHVYYRGLKVEQAFSSLDQGSDHQPLIMTFSPL
ncbi:endonuclease/exonuclease/phosphatase family protein [Motilimonas cestriensis]|nr:endonuclease/exonuclease/phosphatase family protein [Motilimonas cestriensis]